MIPERTISAIDAAVKIVSATASENSGKLFYMVFVGALNVGQMVWDKMNKELAIASSFLFVKHLLFIIVF
jgi:hypothetical protein